jgi:nucleoside-diphosphate-sugar epimerase
MNNFQNSRILIVGGAGFVGSNLAIQLLREKPSEIIIIDNLLSSEKENIPKDPVVSFIEGSITDDAILKQVTDSYDYIFQLATYHGNQSSIYDPIADLENNTLTTVKLFHKIRNFTNIKKIVYSGAGCAVAPKDITNNCKPTTEDSPISLNMDSPYSISKISGEFYSVYFHKQFKLPVVRARFQNVYGPGEILGAGKWRGTPATIWRNVIPTFIYKSLNREELPLQNKGRSSRDFIFVKDICRGLLACALKGTPGDVYNLSTGKETSIAELANCINELTGNPTPCKYLPSRIWDHSFCRYGSPVKAEKELEFTASTNLYEGLHETIKWTKQNLDLIKKNIDKHIQEQNDFLKN